MYTDLTTFPTNFLFGREIGNIPNAKGGGGAVAAIKGARASLFEPLIFFFQIKRHLFDVLDPRRFPIFSDKILGPFWVLLGGKDQY